MSLACKVLDIYDDADPGALLKEASEQGVTPPDYVLTHRLESDPQVLPDAFFAYVHRSPSGGTVRKFACDSKAATWLSGLYFLKHGGVLDPKIQQQIAVKLAEFHALHGVPQPALLTKVAEATATVPAPYDTARESVSESRFALTETVDRPRYPIDTWEHLKAACQFFEENWRNPRLLTPPQRREFAVKVAARVRELGGKFAQHFRPFEGGIIRRDDSPVGEIQEAPALAKVAALDLKQGRDPVQRLPEMLELYASETPCENRIANAIGERIKTMEKRNQQELADTFRALYDNRGSYTVDKFAEALVRMDEASGLDGLYGKRLLDPYLSILKIAEDPGGECVYEEDGIRLTRGDLQKLASMREELYRRFEPGMVEELVADPEAVFPSLPRPEKQALAALLR